MDSVDTEEKVDVKTHLGDDIDEEALADYERYFSTDKRKSMDLSDFGDPERRAFPILNQEDVINAARLIGHAKDSAAVKRRIIAIAKRKGLTLPDSWKDDGDKKESYTGAITHRPKIATIRTCWLEDEAISLNGRQYPKEAVDRLIQSAQITLSDPENRPLTCYISHEAADNDDSLRLVGKVTSVWREGKRAMASIDIADTHAGRDAAELAANGYLITQSLRASNAEMKVSKDHTYPLVGGSSLRLDGIDFTATPGVQVARIQNVALAESNKDEPQRIMEVFNAKNLICEGTTKGTAMEREAEDTQAPKVSKSPKVPKATKDTQVQEEEEAHTEGIREQDMAAHPPTSGNSPYMTNDPTQDAYGQRLYKAPTMDQPGPMQGMSPVPHLVEAHDRIAMVQSRECAPGRGTERYQAAMKGMSESEKQQLQEAGRRISRSNDTHLDVAHDGVAKHLGMQCEGVNNKRVDPDQDGDDDSSKNPQKNPDWALDQMDSKKKENRRMAQTPEEAARLLEAAGYKVERPKTEMEKLQEQLNELKATFAAQQTPSPDPQRKSMVVGANTTERPGKAKVYQHGQYLREQVKALDWAELADRTAPLPGTLDMQLLLKEFEQLLALQYDDRFKILSFDLV